MRIDKRVYAYERQSIAYLRSFDKQLQQSLFPGINADKSGVLLGMQRDGVFIYKKIGGYAKDAKIAQHQAAKIASDYLLRLKTAMQQAVESGMLPIEFHTLFQGLSRAAPNPVYTTDKSYIQFWESIFRPQLLGGEFSIYDDFLRADRRKRFEGQISDEWIKIDVGGNQEVIGVVIARRPIKGIYKREPFAFIPEEQDPEIRFMPTMDPDWLWPFVVNSQAGLLPLQAANGKLRNAQGGELDLFGKLLKPTNSSARSSALMSSLLQPQPKIDPPVDPKDIFPGQILRVFRDDIGFHSRDVGYIPQGQKPPADSFTYPSLARGEILEVIKRTDSGWLHVKRKRDAKEGYVDWRYLEVMPIELGGATIRTLTDASAIRFANTICGLIKLKVVTPTFWEVLQNFLDPRIDIGLNAFPIRDVVPLDLILKILAVVSREFDYESFVLLCIKLRELGCLHKIHAVVGKADIIAHWQLILLMCFLLPLQRVTELLERIAKQEIFSLLWKERKSILRYPTWDDWNPIDRDGMEQRVAEALNEVLPNKNQVIRAFTDNFEYLLRAKYFEISYYLKKANESEIRRLFVEADMLVDLGIEVLFSTDPKNPYLNLPFNYTVVDIWNQLKSTAQVPTIFLLQDGTKSYDVDRGTAPMLSEIFCWQTSSLLTTLPTPVITALTGADLILHEEKLQICREFASGPPSTGTETNAPAGQSPPKIDAEGSKEFAKRLIKMTAEKFKDFIKSDLYSYYVSQPQFLPVINRIMTSDLRPLAAKKLSFSNSINQTFSNQRRADLELQSIQINANSEIIDKMTWVDIARIWYYELGSQYGLGQNGNELEFNIKSTTTKDIRNHPSLILIVEYIKARARAGNFDEVLFQVKYDVNGFWKAIVANDVTFNLLGSFAVRANPDQSTNRVLFTIDNTLSMESATRFSKDESAIAARVAKIDGLIESKERDTPDTVEIGGNLRCRWIWKQALL